MPGTDDTVSTSFAQRLAQKRYDEIVAKPLPAKWDGIPVDWHLDHPWRPLGRALCSRGINPEPETCATCGRARTEELFKWGHLHGLERRLIVRRCPGCGADEVMDWEGNYWDLGPEDYGDDGSSVIGETLFDFLPDATCQSCGWSGPEQEMRCIDDGVFACVDHDMCWQRVKSRRQQP